MPEVVQRTMEEQVKLAEGLCETLREHLVKATEAGQAWRSDWWVTNEEADDGGSIFRIEIMPRK